MTDDHEAEAAGRGYFGETEIEVPGTPEQVWRAIATGRGRAGWTFPTEPASGDGDELIIDREPFAPAVTAAVTSWDQPHRLGYTEPVPGAPTPLATEILVVARSGDSCVVRVVCGFADVGDEWEDLVESAVEGWRMTLLVLRAYLRHFAGRPARSMDLITMIASAPAGRAAPADALFTRLGLPADDRAPGRRFTTATDAPELSGVVEAADAGYLLLRAEEPYPALIAISCFRMGMDLPISINLMGRVYDAPDEARLDRRRSQWRTWLNSQAATI